VFEWYEDLARVYIVMEYCSGGELFKKIISIGYFTERDAATLFKQMMNAVLYCTQKGICHKDLKPENFLFASKEPNSGIKLIDFGLSQVFSVPGIGKVRMSAPVGTVFTIV
jgi:calcium-dependent protein kinase